MSLPGVLILNPMPVTLLRWSFYSKRNRIMATIASSSLPFERGVQTWSQTIVFPVFTHKFKQGDKLRVVLKKGDGAEQKHGAMIAYDPSNAEDTTMNIRLTRLRNEDETYD